MITTERILIADDDERMRGLLKMYLQNEGYSLTEAQTGEEALALAKEINFSLIILDVMMPELDGWAVCKYIRQFSEVPIVFLTARGEEFEKILGFELGADDYLVKPFSPRELLARVNALLRRTRRLVNAAVVLRFPRLCIIQESRRVKIDNQSISLSPKEYNLLYYMAKSEGKVLTREQLAENVWGFNSCGDLRTVDTHIKQLRNKLGREVSLYIKTLWGVGYKFEVEP